MHRCPHDNTTCQPGRQCGACSGEVLQDGERVRVSMLLRDEQRSVCDSEAREASNRRRVEEAAANAAKAEAHADHYREQHAAREQALRHHGYAAACDFSRPDPEATP